jgi:hypothetical protein
MPIDAKFVFGLRASEIVTLTITGQPGAQPPDLRIRTYGQANDAVIAYRDGAWTTSVTAGDHVVWMEAPDERWFDGEVRFTLSASSTIVSYGGAASPKLLAWPAVSGAVRDPKYPGPPPLAAAPLPDQTWLGATLLALKQQLSVARSADPRSLPSMTAR